jgi:NADPH:quinone reductase-like Zn-dependent oxidoreductase
MKAIGFSQTGAPENIEILDIPKPGALKKNEVRLEFLAGSLNHLDLWVVKGLPHLKYSFPHIAGMDFCGRVIESKSKKFRRDDRLIVYPGTSSGRDALGKKCPENLCPDFKIPGENAPGFFVEELVVQDRYLLKAPRHLSDAEAATLPLVFITAWQMLSDKGGIHFKNADHTRILVHGAGSGVTQALLALLSSMKAKNVAVTSRKSEKLHSWTQRGFAGFVWNEKTFEELKAFAGSERFTHIFDHVGESIFEMNIRLLATNGKFIACGATSGHQAKLDLRHLFFRQLQLLGSTIGSLKHFHEVVSWIAKKRIRPTIDRTFSFDEARNAYRYLHSAEQTGKIALLKS